MTARRRTGRHRDRRRCVMSCLNVAQAKRPAPFRERWPLGLGFAEFRHSKPNLRRPENTIDGLGTVRRAGNKKELR